MSLQPDAGLSNAILTRLNAEVLSDEVTVRKLLEIASNSRCVLQGRRTATGELERAWIRTVEADHLILKTSGLKQLAGSRSLLQFGVAGRIFSFSAVAIDDLSRPMARVSLPRVLYVAERRDRYRLTSKSELFSGCVRIRSLDASWSSDASVEDYSPVGLNVRLTPRVNPHLGESVEVRFESGDLAGTTRWGQIKYIERNGSLQAGIRAGLAISEAKHAPPLEVEHRTRITDAGRWRRFRTGLSVLSAGAASVSARTRSRGSKGPSQAIELVDFKNSRGERLRGILDRTHSEGPITGVVIPPAWGRTKETLLPLALTIVETFRKAGEGVAVLRFDGTRRRGESYREPGSETPGTEHLSFRLSHAIEDVTAAARFLKDNRLVDCSKVVLITFSAASIEGRRAILLDTDRIFAGWVSVVGAPDFQSGLRAVSGGVDYVGGAERGVAFGPQEVMGVAVDIDALVEEAIRERLPFLEDARRDMEAIRVPITWIHGAHDGWLDLDRVREIMGCGGTETRRLIEVPTGHQLRTSLEALEVFQLVAAETASIATGRKLMGVLPNLKLVDARRVAERARLPKVSFQAHDFWRSYLVGRDGEQLGIELMNATRAYHEMMNIQIDSLRLTEGGHIADIGSGTGSFPLALIERGDTPRNISIDEIDFVTEGHERARRRLGDARCRRISVQFECCDLENPQDRRRIFAPRKYDAALLSLVLGYVASPVEVLRDLRIAMRNRGRIVVSAMRKDTDMSKVFFEGIEDLRAGRVRERFGEEAESTLDTAARQFLNEASRIIDLEEAGVFRFLDGEEVASMLEECGFAVIDRIRSFGDPAQAMVIVAETKE